MVDIWSDIGLQDRLSVSLSLVTWHPEDSQRTEWVAVNEARCRLVGMSREELLSRPPMDRLARETSAQLERITDRLVAEGSMSIQSMLLHKSHRPVPVMMHISIVEHGGERLMLTEHQDITVFKDTEAQLTRTQDRARNIMALISDEKRQIAENIRGNVGLVALPLIKQLRTTAEPRQRDLLDVLERRILYVTSRLGVNLGAGPAWASLTRREMLVCEMIRDGLSSKEIATALGCSPSTINNHRNTIRRKLGLSGRSENLQAHLNRIASEVEAPADLGTAELDGLI